MTTEGVLIWVLHGLSVSALSSDKFCDRANGEASSVQQSAIDGWREKWGKDRESTRGTSAAGPCRLPSSSP